MELNNYYLKNCFQKFQSYKLTSFKIILSFVILFLTTNSFSQQKSNVSNNEYLHDLQIEKFYLHTNKTIYFSGEKIWLKAYIVNDTDNKPSLETTNLHLNFYDSKKKLISKHLFLVENGTAFGDIQTSKELISGKYFIELTTEWNQNFNNNASVTSIDIQNSSLQVGDTNSPTASTEIINTQITEKDLELNLQFFPESNVLLENIKNTIAFTSKYNDKVISISGKIIDDQTGIIVAKFKSNYFGMGSFELYCRPNRTYTAFVDQNGNQQQFTIPKAQINGFVIEKNKAQTNDSSINFILKSNETTINENNRKYVFAVLHRNGSQRAIIPIQLKKKIINYSFNIANANLFDGVNTITLFDKTNTPISSYSFFNKSTKDIPLEVTSTHEKNDSLVLNFSMKNSTAKTNLSISILPEETKVYANQSSIETAFLIAPYLENAHLNLLAIFESNNAENIDLIIQTSVKENTFPYKKSTSQNDKIILAENGLKIKGNVSSNVKDLTGYTIMLSSKENNLLLIEPIGESNTFSFENLHLKDSTNYKLALLDTQGEIIKTGFRLNADLISYQPNEKLEKTPDYFQQKSSTPFIDENSFLPIIEGTTLLDEVDLSWKQKRKNTIDELEELGIPPDIMSNDFGMVYIIGEDEFALSVFDYLQRIGGIKVDGDSNIGFTIRSTRGRRSITTNTPPYMAIRIDGFHMNDTESLLSRRANEFSAITVSQTGAGFGILAQNGVVSFYTRKGNYRNNLNSTNPDIVFNQIEFGFSPTTQFENSLMQYANKISKKHYETIGWFPNLDITPNSSQELKIHKNGHQEIKVIINGMNTNGDLIFKIVTIH